MAICGKFIFGNFAFGKFIFGTNDPEFLNGSNRNDFIFGFDGDDYLLGNKGNDVIVAGGGTDTAEGGRGNDTILGGTHDDGLYGDAGNDRLFGQTGNDGLSGGNGNDVLTGGAGNDIFVGGAGKDQFFGGDGSDKFVARHHTGQDIIKDFESIDRIDVRDFGFASGQAVIDAFRQVGHDAVLKLPDGDKLIIEDTRVADLSADQFIVSNAAQGVSSSATPYIVGVDPSISTVAIATVGDVIGVKSDGTTPYRMVGTPDGLGAFDNGDGTFTVLMNQELGGSAGAVRDHGFAGSFVSKLIIDKVTLQVTDASDLIQHGFQYDVGTGSYVSQTGAFNRFCSADLADSTAFYNPETGLGYDGGRIFLNGEENGTGGRAFAHFVTGAEAGNSYELAWLGNMSYENVVANAFTGDKTVVALTDDSTGGQVYFYSGDKQASGSALERAGLTGGHMFGLKVDEISDETSAANPLGADNESTVSLIDLGDVSQLNGAQLEAASEAAGVTSFLRPEDGAWDVFDYDRFYFVTTNGFDQPSRLWAVDFVDSSNLALGGTVKLLLDGTEGQHMFDNITVNRNGHVLLQEDPGNQDHIAKIWDYDPDTDQLTLMAQHDPNRFDPNLNGPGVPGADFITRDEESSGIIDVTDILGSAGQYAYLLDVQAHKSLGGELVENGQLVVMYQDRV